MTRRHDTHHAVGIFLCPAAAVKSSWKRRFVAGISNRPRLSTQRIDTNSAVTVVSIVSVAQVEPD